MVGEKVVQEGAENPSAFLWVDANKGKESQSSQGGKYMVIN
jgi:hypothetical protein